MPIAILVLAGLLALMTSTPVWVVLLLLFIGGIWMVSGGSRRARRRERRARRQWQGPPPVDRMPAPPPLPQMPQPLPPPPQPVVNLYRLPPEAQKQVDRIERKAKVLGAHPDRFPIGSKDFYTIQQTAAEYLPSTVKTYLEVPTWSVDKPTADGRTPVEILTKQLDLLEGKLDEIAEQVRKQRVDNMLANERFLEENFGKPADSEELTIPR